MGSVKHFRMHSLINIVMLVISMLAVGEAKDDLDNIVKKMKKDMRMEMNAMIGIIANTQEELKMTQTEVLELKTKIIKLEKHLKNAEDDLAVAINDQTVKNQELERDVTILKEPPFIHACGSTYLDNIHVVSQTIPYSTLLYSSTNTEGGGLDMTTGIFSCPHPGSYTVTWSLSAGNDAGDRWVEIFLRKNGQNINESYHRSRYTGPSGAVYEQGGRSLVLHLDIGDSLDLFCSNCEAGIYYAIFCVSLTTFDII